MKRRYGVCFSDGAIRIRLHHVTTGRPLKYSSLVNTLCHELAHLRHFNHGPRFKTLYLRILEYARAQGIYRPRRAQTGRDGRFGVREATSPLAAPIHAAASTAPPPPSVTRADRGAAEQRRGRAAPSGSGQLELFGAPSA